MDRARAQKQISTQSAAGRVGELDQRLAEILQGEAQLMAFKDRIEASLP